jgi:EAL domain-containing protein (putative c-di-GMP-specific phosphodiesterase class I)
MKLMTTAIDDFGSTRSILEAIIGEVGITPNFQPIVDLLAGTVVAWEVLSRGIPPLVSPDAMFEAAKEAGLSWDLERACRTAAFRKIASLPGWADGAAFFINVSPDILTDGRTSDL